MRSIKEALNKSGSLRWQPPPALRVAGGDRAPASSSLLSDATASPASRLLTSDPSAPATQHAGLVQSFLKAVLLALLIPAIAVAHGGMPDIKGTIVQFDKNEIVVKRTSGQTQTIALTSETTYRVGQSTGRWDDLRNGSRVVVHLGHDGKAMEVHLPGK